MGADSSTRSLLAIAAVAALTLGAVYGFRRLRPNGDGGPLPAVPRAALSEVGAQRLLALSIPLRTGAGEWEIIEFTDYDCPPCQYFFGLSEREEVVPASVGLRIVHTPLVMHPGAYAKAKFMIQQNLKGKGREAHQALVGGFTPPAEKVSDPVSRALLNRQLEFGEQIGIKGTPTLFLVHRRGRVYRLEGGTRVAPLLARLANG